MNILFYGGHYWDRGPWFRKQQFASRLSKRGHRVFYVEDSPSIIRRKKNDKNLFFKTVYKKINNNLFIITPSAVFPFPRNYHARNLYNKKLFYDIGRIFKKEGVDDYILWTNRIEIGTLLNKLKKVKIIDICDDIPFYQKLAGYHKGYLSAKRFFELTLKSADVVIVSAQKIKEKYEHLTSQEIIVIPNGHSIYLNNETKIVLNNLESIPSPRIGFLGTLFQFTDDILLEYIIKERPSYNFIFLGDVDNSFPIEKIKNFNNVYFLGKISKDLVSNYIRYFDVCLNPFKNHEVNDSVSPVKVFEYLALRKPVVSTKMYSLMYEDIANYIYFAGDKQEYLKIIDGIVKNSQYNNNIPLETIQSYHWDDLFLKMICAINAKYDLNL
jgi:hypothetical protein